MSSTRFVVGKIKRPHGLAGEVEIRSYSDVPSRFDPAKNLFLAPPLSYHQLTVERSVSQGDRLIVKFKEISSIEQAEELRGCLLEIPLEMRENLPENTFWVSDLIGLDVVTIDGRHLGRLEEIIRTGSNDVYTVKTGKKSAPELYVPAIKDVVKNIDLKNKRMIIEPIDGMLDEED